jgi:ribosomal protein S18 acetylase RimI-like enzyme
MGVCMVTEPITIRRATTDDIPFLRKMIWEAVLASPSFIEAHQGLDALAQGESERWQSWQPQAHPAFVAEDAAGRKLGAITLRPHPSPDGPGWQLGLGVEEHVRYRGIGRQLLEKAVGHLRAVSAPYLTLHVDESNAPAVALYHHAGFVDIGAEEDGVREMRLPLK